MTSARVWRGRGLRALAVSVALVLGLGAAARAWAYETPARLNEVARQYSLGVGEVRCASVVEWQADPYSSFHRGYTNVRADYTVLPPLVCAGALNVADDQLPAWQRALGTLVLVHEAFHLRHWRFRRDEGKVECQAIVYFTEAAQKLTPTEVDFQFSLSDRDIVVIGVNSGTKTVHVKYGAIVSSWSSSLGAPPPTETTDWGQVLGISRGLLKARRGRSGNTSTKHAKPHSSTKTRREAPVLRPAAEPPSLHGKECHEEGPPR